MVCVLKLLLSSLINKIVVALFSPCCVSFRCGVMGTLKCVLNVHFLVATIRVIGNESVSVIRMIRRPFVVNGRK